MTTGPELTTPKSLQPLLRRGLTPFISNGKRESSCCNFLRQVFGCDSALEECSSSLFQPTQILKQEAEESDTTTAHRILETLEYHRRDIETIHEILPSSAYEGLEFREKLKECDKLGAVIQQAERQRSLQREYEKNKAEYDRLGDIMPRLQSEAERTAEEKRRKEHDLSRKKLRRQVIEEEASEREQRREERAERRHQREMQERTQRRGQHELVVEGVDTERLLPPRRGGRVIRRIREVEIPQLDADIKELEEEIVVLHRTLEEFRRTKDRVRELEHYLTRTVPPSIDEAREEADRRSLRGIRNTLKERNPRMFNYLLEDRPENHTKHENDFDTFYDCIDSGSCTCGKRLAAHQVMLVAFPKESKRLEDRLTRFARVEDSPMRGTLD